MTELGDAWQQLEEHNHEQWVKDYEAHESEKWAPVPKDYWKGQEMGITVKDTGGGGDFVQANPGTCVGICFRIIDLGTQHNEKFDNDARKIIVEWEIPSQEIDIEGIKKPLAISNWYTASLNEKANLRRDLEAWRGKPFTDEELSGFDVKNILGKSCLLTILQSDKGKSYVKNVTALPKEMSAPAQFNEDVFFSLEDYNDALFQSLPKGIQDIIKKSPEWRNQYDLSVSWIARERA